MSAPFVSGTRGIYSISISDRSQGSMTLKLLKRDAANANLNDRQVSVVNSLHKSTPRLAVSPCAGDALDARINQQACVLVEQVRICTSAYRSIHEACPTLQGSNLQVPSKVEGEQERSALWHKP